MLLILKLATQSLPPNCAPDIKKTAAAWGSDEGKGFVVKIKETIDHDLC